MDIAQYNRAKEDYGEWFGSTVHELWDYKIRGA
jgi:hypothetical protein